MPLIKVHHLNNSRSQRVLWLLEETGLDYDLMSFLARIHARPAYQRALSGGGPYAYAR